MSVYETDGRNELSGGKIGGAFLPVVSTFQELTPNYLTEARFHASCFWTGLEWLVDNEGGQLGAVISGYEERFPEILNIVVYNNLPPVSGSYSYRVGTTIDIAYTISEYERPIQVTLTRSFGRMAINNSVMLVADIAECWPAIRAFYRHGNFVDITKLASSTRKARASIINLALLQKEIKVEHLSVQDQRLVRSPTSLSEGT